MKILLLIKSIEHCQIVKERVQNSDAEVTVIEGKAGESWPDINWKGDYIISFLSSWIVPESWLNRVKISINFHPGPPKYPGICPYNLAIYNRDKTYGVTCHYMLPDADIGKIIRVIRFPITEVNYLTTLRDKARDYTVKLFYDIWEYIISGKSLPQSREKWLRKPYTRKNLRALCKITSDMDEEEVKLRIRATYLPGAKDLSYVDLFGYKFIYSPDDRE